MDLRTATETLLNSGQSKKTAVVSASYVASILHGRGLTFEDLSSMTMDDMMKEFGNIHAPAAFILAKGPNLKNGVVVEEIEPGVYRIHGDRVVMVSPGIYSLGE